ncbi:hypothetical protein BegalDRAFT_3411 [Beggiatoa alba B18LD]|uniref:Uncharacterized protein n=1 Tax=Beggiatoa alba B18LD TaxID=395493 RepID=I3CKT5_9GAMM|nr:hypothetical protein [Beggiatoa alba]EIJ44228.1 hypothetical protein BegalDRAFT_3411 [Beggiatoa alba B18LD]
MITLIFIILLLLPFGWWATKGFDLFYLGKELPKLMGWYAVVGFAFTIYIVLF